MSKYPPFFNFLFYIALISGVTKALSQDQRRNYVNLEGRTSQHSEKILRNDRESCVDG